MAITVSPAVGLYFTPQTITLTSDNPLLDKIRYTIDGSDPRTYLSPIYTTPFILSAPAVIQAVEIVEDDTPSAIFSFAFNIADPAQDADGDTIPDAVELGPDAENPTDTDLDGVPDFQDPDADNDDIPDATEAGLDPLAPIDTDTDGLPDYVDTDADADTLPDKVEGVEDFNDNLVPNYIDPLQVPQLIVEFKPPLADLELVEYVPLTFQVLIRNGSGAMGISNISGILLGLDSTTTPIPVSAGDVFTYTVMASACRTASDVSVTFYFSDAFDGSEQLYTFTWHVVKFNSEYPLLGANISWKKNAAAQAYRIYRKQPNEAGFSLLVEVMRDYTNSLQYQWYLDRGGLPGSRYTVAAVDYSGVEGVPSLPRHSPDIEASVCLVQGNVADIGMVPIQDVTIACRIKEMPGVYGNTMVLRGSNIVLTDARGYFEFVVPQGSLVVLAVDEVGFKKSLIVPNSPAVDLRELLAMPQNQ